MKFVKRSIYLLLAIAMVFSFNAAIEYETLAVEKMNDELLELIRRIADGEMTKNEKLGNREIAIFKDGVTL